MSEHSTLINFLRDDSKAATGLLAGALRGGHKMKGSSGAGAVLPKKASSIVSSMDDAAMAEMRERNKKRFGGQAQQQQQQTGTAKSGKRRRGAAAPPAAGIPTSGGIVVDRSVHVFDARRHMRGTSLALEKSYLRLTSAPDPSTVRPPERLRECLEHVKRQWVKNEDYAWCCDQLKAIRQDLVVQGVRDELTVQTYAHHMRMALEYGDMNEFNQCQTALQQFREEGLALPVDLDDEFNGYLLLYLLHFADSQKLVQTLRRLSPAQLRAPITAFAMAVWRAVSHGDYCAYFKLYHNAPRMAPYLLDYRLNAMRELAYARMVSAYNAVPLARVAEELAFASEAECRAFVTKRGAVLTPDANIDMRSTRAAARR